MTNDNLANAINQKLTTEHAPRKMPWLDTGDGNTAFRHHGPLADGLQAQFEEYKKHTGRD